jgi:hypothetical protein
MAQIGYSPILLYSSSTASAAPLAGNLTNSTLGSELAINITDGKLFYKDNSAAVQVIAWKTTPTTAGGTGLTSYTAGDLPYYASGSALSKLGIGTANYVLTSSGTAPQYVAQSTLSVGTATNATNTAITDNTSSSATWYPTIVSATTGNLPQTTSSTKLSFVPSTGTLTATSYAGAWAGSTIGTTYGGTGQTSYAVGDLLYADTTTTLAKLADVATGNALISGGVGVAPSWGKIGLTTHVNGTLPVANGGTNASSASITAFNNITGYSAAGATGTTTTNLVFSTSPTLVTPTLGAALATSIKFGSGTVLSNYEEGTWTPAPNSGTFSSKVGQYTRIGRVVTLQFNVTVGTGGGTSMTGNPFTTYGGANAVAVSSTLYTEGQTYPTGATTAQVLLGGGGSTISFVGVGSVIGPTSMTLSASALLIGSITFIV